MNCFTFEEFAHPQNCPGCQECEAQEPTVVPTDLCPMRTDDGAHEPTLSGYSCVYCNARFE